MAFSRSDWTTSALGIIVLMNSWASIISIMPICDFVLSNFLHALSNFLLVSRNFYVFFWTNEIAVVSPSYSNPFHFLTTSSANFLAFFLLRTYFSNGLPSSPHPYSQNLENSYEMNLVSSLASVPGL